MTPEIRAVKVVEEWGGMCDRRGRERLIELIRVAVIEATNDELTKRRAAENELARARTP